MVSSICIKGWKPWKHSHRAKSFSIKAQVGCDLFQWVLPKTLEWVAYVVSNLPLAIIFLNLLQLASVFLGKHLFFK